MRFYSVVSRKTLWHNKTAAVAKNNTLSAKYRTSKFIFFWWCVVASFISALAFSRSFANWIVIAWNACTHNASFVLKYTSEIKYIYATSFAHVQTIRPSALVFKYRNTHIRSTRSQYFACHRLATRILFQSFALQQSQQQYNYMHPISMNQHMSNAQFFSFWNWNRTTRSDRI